MPTVVTDNEFQTKQQELKVYADRIIEEITAFKDELSNVSETIEALKICANTAGGVEKIRQLSNLNFDTKILDKIESIITNTSIKETQKETLIEKII